MGRIANYLSFTRIKKIAVNFIQIITDQGGGIASRNEVFNPSGVDSLPILDDKVLLIEIERAGGKVAIGYIDTKNIGVAKEGENRLYSRDINGDLAAQIYLKNDGGIVINNDKGLIDLRADGSVNINGVVVDTNGNITTNGDIEGAEVRTSGDTGVALSTHQHPTAAIGPPSPPTPGT